jgi:primosomal protein N' (replication factor Y) (superfamily II helicase)
MSSAAPSSSGPQPSGPLSGPVAVCVDRPILSLDRPFTYDLPASLEAEVGSLVRVRFHGRRTLGWVLGPTDDVPAGMLPVLERVSPVPWFDGARLELFRWMAERYVAPLATVIDRSVPPRVASEEAALASVEGDSPAGASTAVAPFPRAYANGEALWTALGSRSGTGTFLVRPAPGDDAELAVACIARALAGGRGAILVVPEVEPVPATVSAVHAAFGDAVVDFTGGDKRSRYRTWLRIASGEGRVVVGTRGAVFAPLRDLGLIYVAREQHSRHREERAPYFHAREVAVARSRIEDTVAVLASVMPSLEAQATTHVEVTPARRAWPPVEIVRPGPEGRAPRLLRALASARRAFVYEAMRGAGVARVCRVCSEPAACAVCGGLLREEEGEIRCVVCEAPGRCANCGASDFGIARGGAERVEAWVRRVASVPVTRVGGPAPSTPGEEGIVVGGMDAVKDVGQLELDLVAILGADATLRRPGISARSTALGVWAEAVAWVGPRGRAIVQSDQPNDHAVQALVAGNPERFARTEAPRLAAAGFPVGAAVFRVTGNADLGSELSALAPTTLLTSALGDATVCLVALALEDVPAFGERVRTLAGRGIVTRVEAEPHL